MFKNDLYVAFEGKTLPLRGSQVENNLSIGGFIGLAGWELKVLCGFQALAVVHLKVGCAAIF